MKRSLKNARNTEFAGNVKNVEPMIAKNALVIIPLTNLQMALERNITQAIINIPIMGALATMKTLHVGHFKFPTKKNIFFFAPPRPTLKPFFFGKLMVKNPPFLTIPAIPDTPHYEKAPKSPSTAHF